MSLESCPFILGCQICWHTIVHSILLWFFIFFHYPLWFLLFHFCVVYLGFFSPLLGESGQSFVNFVYPFKDPLLVLLISYLIFMISFLLVILGFVCSSFSHSFRWLVMLLTWDFSSLRKAYVTMNFSLSSTFVTSHRFWMVVSSLTFVLSYFLISFLISSVTHWFFSSMLLSLHVVFFFLISFPVVDF